ncbi:hypothetical protein Mesau_00900 [Mesorhizobium australicum WSM2073]|uniref:Uncharacterized protein n=1 Tax=Mesorhizobium australicum (strain HAMBI 3006 / LMG 24608 / WSM2073) TaxID=754035 RepID=L0KG83_MESAW|nr:hypothetical protein [Mesorhizobium australicum]AGB43384.1 hypothetical protein Mesau_00900 [Mesorhizobium australicum WSM2073]
MAVAKKDQERVGYAWLYGVQARKDGRERVVPEFWKEYADVWLQGFDGESVQGAGKAEPVGDQMEAEVDEAGVSKL